MADHERFSIERLQSEVDIDYFKSSGPGGQKKNKPVSAVRLHHRPTGIVVTATERRSQHQNRALAFDRLRERLIAHFFVPTPRVRTRPTHGSRLDRLQDKRRHSERKQNRRPPRLDG